MKLLVDFVLSLHSSKLKLLTLGRAVWVANFFFNKSGYYCDPLPNVTYLVLLPNILIKLG